MSRRELLSKICMFFVDDVLHVRVKAKEGIWTAGAEPLAVPIGQGAMLRFKGRSLSRKRSCSIKAWQRNGRWFWDLKVPVTSPLLCLLCVPKWLRPDTGRVDELSDEAREKIGISPGADGVVILGVFADRVLAPSLFADATTAVVKNASVLKEAP